MTEDKPDDMPDDMPEDARVETNEKQIKNDQQTESACCTETISLEKLTFNVKICQIISFFNFLKNDNKVKKSLFQHIYQTCFPFV